MHAQPSAFLVPLIKAAELNGLISNITMQTSNDIE